MCKKEWNVRSYYVNYEEMLNNENIDILSICTQPDSHEDIVIAAVKNGVKAIFCEKPISNNLNSANVIIHACKKQNILLAINHYRRWDRFYIKLKDDILNGVFGEIQHINFYYTRGISNSGSHMFDLLRYLFGEITSIQTFYRIEEILDDPTFSCNLIIDDNIPCNLIGLNGSHYRIFNLEVYGTLKSISIDTSKNIKIFKTVESTRSSEFKELVEQDHLYNSFLNEQYFLNSLTNIIDTFEQKNNLLCTGTDGLKSLELIIAAKLSYELQTIIELPLKTNDYTKSI